MHMYIRSYIVNMYNVKETGLLYILQLLYIPD